MITYPRHRVRGTAEPRPAAPVTLPSITAFTTTDADLGLSDDPVAQRRCEFEIRRAVAQRLVEDAERRAARDRLCPGYTDHLSVPDDSMTLQRPTDAFTPLEREIFVELERIASRPVPRWMTTETPALAS